MELDKTRIAVRQRSMLDIIDLSIVVIRTYWVSLAVWSIPSILFLMIVNGFVLYPLTRFESIAIYSNEFESIGWLRLRYLWYLAAFTSLQSGLAFMGTTFYLGQAVFVERPSFGEFRSAMREMRSTILWVVGILRLGLLSWFIILLFPSNMKFEPILEVFWFGIIIYGISTIIRIARPFPVEILILERAKLFPKKVDANGSLSYSKRSKYLHGAQSADMVGRWAAVTSLMIAFVISLTLGELCISGMFFGEWRWGWWMDIIIFPLNLWVAAFLATVIRFLSYLDTRIRAEGWELTLRMRAESKRIQGVAS